MRKSLIALAVIALTVLATMASVAQTAKPVTRSKSVTVQSTITDIDKPHRIVTLKGPSGNLVDVYTPEKVKRFNELKVGDVVTVTYTESLALKVRKPGEAAPSKQMSGVNLRQGKPGATSTQQRTVTVSVEAIDKSLPSITVKDGEGHVSSFLVRDAKNLEGVNAGDKIDITYTLGVLIKADAPAK
jgi:hypothetical protein